MEAPLFSTKNNLKVQATLFKDRLQVKDLGFNPLNKSDQIKLQDVRRVKFIAAGPGEDPRRISLAVEKHGEGKPYVIAGLNTTEAYNLKEKIERLKASAPSHQPTPTPHPFTVAGRVNQSLTQKKSQASPKIRQFNTSLRRFGKSF